MTLLNHETITFEAIIPPGVDLWASSETSKKTFSRPLGPPWAVPCGIHSPPLEQDSEKEPQRVPTEPPRDHKMGPKSSKSRPQVTKSDKKKPPDTKHTKMLLLLLVLASYLLAAVVVAVAVVVVLVAVAAALVAGAGVAVTVVPR